MLLEVEIETGEDGIDAPRRLRLDGRMIDVIENIDQWHGRDYRYFKVICADGNLYILRLDENRSEWELTMFQHPDAEAFAAGGPVRKPHRADGP